MTSVRFLFEPLDDGPSGPDIPTAPEIPSRFATPWSRTLNDLDREVWALGATEAVIEVDVDRRAIRQDGGMRADAKVRSRRVRVSFTSAHGPLSFSSGRFVRSPGTAQSWQDNVRAIALTLESLRRVDRYGVITGGEQYRGFLAIEAGPVDGVERDPFTNADEAWRWVQGRMDAVGPEADDLGDPHRLVRRAQRDLHPDRTGDRGQWDRLERAIVLLRAGGLL